MAEFNLEIIIFDGHEVRGCALKEMVAATRIVRKCDLHNCDFEVGSRPNFTPIQIVSINNQSNLGIYVLGGNPLSHPDVLLCLSRIFAHFPDIVVVALCDECSHEDIGIALHLGLQGIISSRLPKKAAIAAIEFVLAGGRYFPPPYVNSKISVGLPDRTVVEHSDARSDFGLAVSSRSWLEAMAEDEPAASADDPDLAHSQAEVLGIGGTSIFRDERQILQGSGQQDLDARNL